MLELATQTATKWPDVAETLVLCCLLAFVFFMFARYS